MIIYFGDISKEMGVLVLLNRLLKNIGKGDSLDYWTLLFFFNTVLTSHDQDRCLTWPWRIRTVSSRF